MKIFCTKTEIKIDSKSLAPTLYVELKFPLTGEDFPSFEDFGRAIKIAIEDRQILEGPLNVG